MKKTLLSVFAFVVGLAATAQVTLTPIGSYHTGVFDASATEIMAWNAADQRVYSTNGSTVAIDVIDLSDPTNPVLDFSIDVSTYGSGVNSVAYFDGYVVAAVEANDPQANGSAVFFDADGNFVVQVTVGAMPDMITVSPDGMKVLTANEGEPNDAYTVDPLGSVSIIDISGGVANLQQTDVTTLDFTAFNSPAPINPDIRIFGPNASVAQDLEPEYITITHDSQLALVVCQENNAIVGIDLSTNTILAIQALGFKDHSVAGNSIDASNQDGSINIHNWPVFGMYQPDAIDNYSYNGSTYVVTANEGDSRDYGGFSEEARVRDLTLDATAFPDGATLQLNENLGRLNITVTLGDDGNDNDYDALYSYGARSFSIWDLSGNLVYDSGNDFETFISTYDATNFNSNNDGNTSFDSRSDDKGPEPEALKVVSIMGKTYAFIGLERQGGVMVYDITDPNNVSFESYGTDRDFNETEGTPAAGGLGPEDIDFIPAAESPTGFPLLLVSNEVSGSISVYSVSGLPTADPLVITEIMYNPPESGTDSLEFVEIFNPSVNDVDLSGYFFRDGIDFVFPQGATIPGYGFSLVAVDPVAFENNFGISAWQWTGGALSNGGEELVLAAPSGSVADSVNFDDGGSWPTDADGNGYSIVKCGVWSDGNDGANWSLPSDAATGVIINGNELFAHPGELCAPSPVVISEIMYNPPESGTDSLEFIELFNPDLVNPVDLEGYSFADGVEYTFPAGASIPAGGFLIVAVDSVAFESNFGIPAWQWTGGALSNGGEEVVLAAPFNVTVDSVNYDDAWYAETDGDGYSLTLCDLAADNTDGANWAASTDDAGFMINGNQVYADPNMVGTCITVEIDEEIITTIVRLYPNPNDGNFMLEFSELESAANAAIYNATGQLIHSFQVINAGQVTVSENLSAGIYMLQVEMGGSASSHRFVVR